MRYRPLDADGDYTVGTAFLVNSAACVAQAILTRLRLWRGEWFLDVTEGTPYSQQVLGKNAAISADAAIKQRILQTPGVDSITSYSSVYDGTTRALSITCTVQTQFGPATLTAPIVVIPQGLRLLTGAGETLQTDEGVDITMDT